MNTKTSVLECSLIEQINANTLGLASIKVYWNIHSQERTLREREKTDLPEEEAVRDVLTQEE